MASSRSSEVSLVLHGMQNSLFTHYLLEALKGESISYGDGVVRVFDVFHYVSDRVPVRAANSPRLSTRSSRPGTSRAISLWPCARAEATGAPASGPGSQPALATRPAELNPKARIAIKNGLVHRWDDLADYFGIARRQGEFQPGYEAKWVLDWLEERKRLGELRDAFNYLGLTT